MVDTPHHRRLAPWPHLIAIACVTVSARAQFATEPAGRSPPAVYAAGVAIRSGADQPRPPFAFDDDDGALLDEIQHASFLYLWERIDPTTGLVADRTSNSLVSIAGVGYQLASLPIGVEHGWITRDEARARAELILTSLLDEPTNRKAGLFYHFLEGPTAKPSGAEFEFAVSTIDSAMLFAGAIVSGSFFEGRTSALADAMVAQADWTFFLASAEEPAPIAGSISLAWVPTDQGDPTGDGALLPYHWLDAADEQRLVTLIAIAAPDPDHRVDELAYYRLRRPLGTGASGQPLVYNPYSGALLTYLQAHLWIDYAAMGTDSPSAFGIDQRAEVDWWENSRRGVALHRARSIENPRHLTTLGPNAWGLSACDTPDGYRANGVTPRPIRMLGAVAQIDDPEHEPADEWGRGTIAPAATGASIMFDPQRTLAALRHIKSLTHEDGSLIVWRDPDEQEGYGFRNGYTLDGPGGKPWAAPDDLAIEHGMLLLAIENARTGLVWRLFHRNEAVADAIARLGLPDPIEARESKIP